ncbi:MAG: DUF131 domain-containing protein [Halobacteriales archaeon]|nr:DUF131 domain-containing protein [Halobacteriales archaeon]
MESSEGLPYGFLLILAGFVLIVIGVIVSVLRSLGEGGVDAEAGGVVFIGPIPVVFGTSRGVVWIALAIALLMLVSFFVFYR